MVREISVDLIDSSPYQPRTDPEKDSHAMDELVASIREQGVLQPILVRAAAGGRFQLIAGHRRWAASRKAGKQTVPAIVKQVSNESAAEMTLIENLQREDLNPMEHARAFARLGNEFGLTQEQMAQRTGKDRPSVGNYLRLLKLPETVQADIESGALTFGHAKVLMTAPTLEMQAEIAEQVKAEYLSVRATADLVASKVAGSLAIPEPPAPKPDKPVDPNVRAAQLDMQNRLGCRVSIKDRNGKGKIVIEYRGLEDFDRIVLALTGKIDVHLS
jgi:ParB family chromosome partitioning protein